jgi:invasion protein IalB
MKHPLLAGVSAVIATFVLLLRVTAAELASPPLDPSMFREGELVRSAQAFGAWTLTCDTVVKLQKKYCSLSIQAGDADGKVAVGLIVSTGDDGRPAALLRTASGVALPGGVTVAMRPPDGAKRKRHDSFSRQVDFVRCDKATCSAVWTLAPDEIAGLNAGDVLTFRFQRPLEIVLNSPRSVVAPKALLTVDAGVSAAGFSDAIGASLH